MRFLGCHSGSSCRFHFGNNSASAIKNRLSGLRCQRRHDTTPRRLEILRCVHRCNISRTAFEIILPRCVCRANFGAPQCETEQVVHTRICPSHPGPRDAIVGMRQFACDLTLQVARHARAPTAESSDDFPRRAHREETAPQSIAVSPAAIAAKRVHRLRRESTT